MLRNPTMVNGVYSAMYVPAPGYVGDDVVALHVTDGHGGDFDTTTTFRVRAADFNSPPVCVTAPALSPGPNAGWDFFVPAYCHDDEGDPFTLSAAATNASVGLVSTGSGDRFGVHTGGVNLEAGTTLGAGSVTITATDDKAAAVARTTTFDVQPAPPNHVPTCAADPVVLAVAPGGSVTFRKYANVVCQDLDGDYLDLTMSSPAHGTVSPDPADLLGWVYRPDAGYAGPDRVTVTVNDEHGGKTEWHQAFDVRAPETPTSTPATDTPTATPSPTPTATPSATTSTATPTPTPSTATPTATPSVGTPSATASVGTPTATPTATPVSALTPAPALPAAPVVLSAIGHAGRLCGARAAG